MAFAQTASISGHILDDSGAAIPAASVTLTANGATRNTSATGDGAYSVADLAPGSWIVNATAPNFSLPAPVAVTLRPGPNTLDVRLKVAAVAQRLTVQSDGAPRVSTDPSANAGAIVVSGADLDALSDDPEDLQADLQALAGPSAGPGGGGIFVDGFSGGQLPPKQSIREIRINSNPFSPEYDTLGYGRIEIFTKPGSDKFHASIGYNLGTDFWNSRNPYAAQKAPFLLQETENSFSGPIGHRASFTLDAERQAVDNGAVTNGVTLDPASLTAQPFSSVITSPQRHWLFGPHVDYRINDNNTLTVRYLFTRAAIQDQGIGSFDLISRGSHVVTLFHTAQIGETTVHGNLVNEIRFQFYERAWSTQANQISPVIQVAGSFNGGGASIAKGTDTQNSYELQNYTSLIRGQHFLRMGVRLRAQTDDSNSPSNFGGTFTFSGASGITSIEQYRRTLLYLSLGDTASQIRALGGGPSQFTISAGNPALSVSQFDIAPFFGDDWKIRTGMLLSLGIRYETQTNLKDRSDIAPRLSFSWAPHAKAGKASKTVLRAGAGVFYLRYGLSNTLTTSLFNGVAEQNYVVTNPDFYPTIPAISALAAYRSVQTTWKADPGLAAPRILQSAFSLERELPRNTTMALTYTNSSGQRMFHSQESPGAIGPVFTMESNGRYNQNQMILNLNTKVNPAVSLSSYYTLNRAMSDTDGIGTFAANPGSSVGEYGSAAGDIRHRVLLSGTISLLGNIRLNPNFTASTGAPFNITTGQDNYGTTLFTARPGIATDPSRPGLVQTPYGLLDPNPIAGETLLARNAGRGPATFLFNLRITKTWGFGRENNGGGAVRSSRDNGPALSAPTRSIFSPISTTRKYNLTLGMSGRNILNRNIPGPIIGSITSPLFGHANQISGSPNGEGFLETASNRRLELQLRLAF